MRAQWLTVMALAVLVLAGCAPALEAGDPTAGPGIPTEVPIPQAPATAEPTLDPYPGWTTYTNESFGLGFRFPLDWFGPDVYEFEGGVRLEVGSDKVYPYGTGLDEREPGAPNAYHIVIQYTRNTAGWTLEQYRTEQPWFNDALAVLDLRDGETSATARSLTTRERGLTVGRLTGVEFTTTTSDSAQTERFYMRTAFLMDEDLNVVLINGSPENIEVVDPANWRAAFEAVDAANRAIFDELVGSIQVE